MRRIVSTRSLGLVLGMSIVGSTCSYAQPTNQPAAGTPSLIFSTYLGGSQCGGCSNPRTYAQNAASDAAGNTYVTGATRATDLPVLHAFQSKPAPHAEISAYVAKFDPAGKLLWLTYLGGNAQTTAVGCAALPDGGVVVDGITSSIKPEPFPMTSSAYQSDYAGGDADYFVSVFDKDGNLRYSTYLGGGGTEGSDFVDNNSNGNNLAADGLGLVYLVGTTDSGGSKKPKFPVTPNAIQPDMDGGSDAIVAIIDPGKSGQDSLIYSSFLGGSGGEKGHAAAVSANGDFITAGGYTDSDDFPTTKNAYRKDPPDSGWVSNGFIAQVTSTKPGDPSSEYKIRYATYLGGKKAGAREDVYGMTMDQNGIIVATGRTVSPDFPTTWPTVFHDASFLGLNKSNDSPYMVKIDPSKENDASLVYGTFLGGAATQKDGGGGGFDTSVGFDNKGNVYVAGEMTSRGVQYTYGTYSEAPELFPYTVDALIKALPDSGSTIASQHATFMQIVPSGAWLGYSTYLGGSGSDRAYGLAVDPNGNVVVTGVTSSKNFPVKNPALIWPHNPDGVQNAFITKFSFSQ